MNRMTSLRAWTILAGALLAGVLLGTGLTACAEDAGQPGPTESPLAGQTAGGPHDDDGYSVWLDSDDEDKPDCDAEDKARRETPDCGFVHAGQFHWWSWVADGKKSAPAGWTPGREMAAVKGPGPVKVAPAKPRPAASKPPVAAPPAALATTRPAPAAGTTRATTSTRRAGSPTTRRR